MYKDMKALGEIDTKKLRLDMDMDKEGATCNIEEKRWIKILEQEKHTSRGCKLMNFDWLHLICA